MAIISWSLPGEEKGRKGKENNLLMRGKGGCSPIAGGEFHASKRRIRKKGGIFGPFTEKGKGGGGKRKKGEKGELGEIVRGSWLSLAERGERKSC